jgi:tetratricopeptide (TPR) repeat protein
VVSAVAFLCVSSALVAEGLQMSTTLSPESASFQAQRRFLENELFIARTEEAPVSQLHMTASSNHHLGTTMLLRARGLSSALSTGSNSLQHPLQRPGITADYYQGTYATSCRETSRNRGVLGFSVNDDPLLSESTGTGRRGLKSSSLRAHNKQQRRPTNVDSSAWNVPSRWDVEVFPVLAPSSKTSSILSKGGSNNVFQFPGASAEKIDADAHTTTTTSRDLYRSQIPWVPSKSKIDQLTVVELKQMCRERVLTVTGRKLDLQERLYEWAREQVKLTTLTQSQQVSSLGLSKAYGVTQDNESYSDQVKAPPQKQERDAVPNSLAEWSRTVDLEPLLHRREAIHREKLHGKPVNKRKNTLPAMSSKDFVSVLKKVFDKPSSPYSNWEVKQMYDAAKHADQIGDRALSKRILLELKEATPHDGRIYRRLARLEKEEGNLAAARAILQEGIRGLHGDNAFLWHGLGQIAISDAEVKKCYRKAIQLDPSLPHPYHALGTLEHTQGRIANAMKTLKEGIKYCPSNHRLHHALGDLYRDAKMLEMAERCYRKALEHGPPVSHGFAYTALAYVSYEQDDVNQCRSWLRKAVTLNKGRQANAWVALAQLEESEGNVDAARTVCMEGLAQYERGLLQRSTSRRGEGYSQEEERTLVEDPVALKNEFLKTIPKYRSGDRFFNVYRTWARLEERYGSVESVDEVYHRATVAFPQNRKLSVDWAEYYAALNMRNQARELYADSCARVENRYAEPYRLYAQFEMNLKNYTGAREILYSGALAMSEAPDGGFGNQIGLAELFHTWSICEWHLGEDLSRAENLFDHALRMTEPAQEGSELRAYILYSLARLEYCREEYILAQHCIALCLKENTMPGGNFMAWDLWALIAEKRGKETMAAECRELSSKCQGDADDERSPLSVSRLLSTKRPGSSSQSIISTPIAEMEHLMRRDPWHQKIFASGKKPSNFFHSVRFPHHPDWMSSPSSDCTDVVVARV